MSLIGLVSDANRNLLRNKTRSFLTILAIFIGSFTIILSSAINTGVNDFIDKQLESAGGDGYIEIMSKTASEQMINLGSGEIKEYTSPDEGGTSTDADITNEQYEKAKKIDGIISIDRLQQTSVEYIQLEGSSKKFALTSLNLMPRGNINLDVTAGTSPDPDTKELQIALTEKYVEAFGYKKSEDLIGKYVIIAAPNTIECYSSEKHEDCLRKIKAKVVGVQAPSIMAMGGVRANLALYEKIAEENTDGIAKENIKYYQATATVDPDRVEEIKKALDDIDLTAMTIDDEVGMIRKFFDAMLIVLDVFGGIALLAASIGIVNTLLMSVQERTREIGLDKALGMSNFRIFLNFSFEAIALGFWGSIIGIVISMGAGQIINSIAAKNFLKDLPTFTLVMFDWKNMLAIIGIIMLIAFIAGTLPARKASKKNPIDSLRYE